MVKLPVQIDILIRKDGRLQRVEHLSLTGRGEYGIGRLPENEIRLEAGQVSRNHAYLVVGEDRLEIVDRDSTCGTFIGDRRVEGREPWDGAAPVRIAPYELQLVREEVTRAPKTAPSTAPAPGPRHDGA